MPDEVTKFDAEAMRRRLAEMVHTGLVQLMPEEALMPYIKATEQRFLQDDLPKMVRDALFVKYRKAIDDYLSSPEFQQQWQVYGDQKLPSEAAKEILRQLAPELINQMFGGIIDAAVQDMRNNMRRSY